MITYPLNNIDYTAEDAELYFSTRKSGVYDGGDFEVTVSEIDNDVTVGTGIAWIHNTKFSGKVVALKEPKTLTLSLPNSVYDRIDAIVIQFDANDNATDIIVKEGIASSSPVAPAVVRTESLYELHIFHVQRKAGATVISVDNLVDLRNNSDYCGIMFDPISSIDATLTKRGFAADAMEVGNQLKEVGNQLKAFNLLDNSDFRNPVNQRGASGSIANWTYLIDRWRTGIDPATISFNNGLVCTGYIQQIIAPNCDGKTVTFAAKINGEIFCCSAEINAVTAWTQFAQATTNVGGMGICKYAENNMYVEMKNTSQGIIEWVALYEGNYTPETLPPYMPKGYVAEYVECRRYFRKYVVWQEGLTGYTNWEGIPRVLFYGEPAMRVNPTASVFKASLCIDGTTVSVNETPTKIANYNGMIAVFLGNLNNDNHETKAFGGHLNDVEFTLSADL